MNPSDRQGGRWHIENIPWCPEGDGAKRQKTLRGNLGPAAADRAGIWPWLHSLPGRHRTSALTETAWNELDCGARTRSHSDSSSAMDNDLSRGFRKD